MTASTLAARNRRVATLVGVGAATMLGAAFAAVPLYDLFCRMTGYGGTVQTGTGAAPGAVAGAPVTIRFNATTSPGLPWRFQPAQNSVQLALGEEGIGFYTARNLAPTAVTGVATYNVTPEKVGKYFHKTACFCFAQQTLAPGEAIDMPLAFWIDPRLAQDPNTADVRTITISYSFFRSLDDAALAAAAPHVGARP